MKNIILTLTLVVGATLFAQPTIDVLPSEATGKVEGSPYFDDTFTSAKMEGYTNLYMIRYDAYRDYVEVKNSDGSVGKFEPEENKRIVAANRDVYVYLFYNGTMGYLNEISSNEKVTLYQSNRKYLQPESGLSNGYSTYRPATYKKIDTKYFIKINNGSIVEMPQGKKEFAKLFPGKENEINAYLKSNKVSFSKSDDLKKLVEYVNTIL